MNTENYASAISGFLDESRLVFSVEMDEGLAVIRASKGFSYGEGAGRFEPAGLHFPDLLVNGVKFAEALFALSPGVAAPAVVTFSPPFPAPRTARGIAVRTQAGYFAIFERDVELLEQGEAAGAQTFRREASIHRELFATKDELSLLRRDLSLALDRLRSLEALRSMQRLIAPLIGKVADEAREVSSLAVILATRIGGADADNDELLSRLESRSALLHESAKRLGRGLM